MTAENVTLYEGDCLQIMQSIPDGSVDCIVADLPYGTTACKWDVVIPFAPLWEQYQRVIKENGAIVLFGRQPFASDLIVSNRKMYRYEIIWNKKTATDFAQANNKPLTVHENILVFYKKKPTYNRIDDTGFKAYSDKRTQKKSSELGAKGCTARVPIEDRTTRAPTTIREYFPDNRRGKGSSLHPTQKPVALLEWLVKSYTNEGETVLDNCMGSGSTGVACLNTGRRFIGIEKDPHYFQIAKERIDHAAESLPTV